MGRGLTVSSLDGASPRTPAICARLSGFRPGFASATLITARVAIGFLLLPVPNSAVQASAVGQVPPPRDPSGSGRTLATIQGRVTSVDTGGPIRLALVTVDTRPRDAETGVMTDDEGRYELQVPAGRYTLSVSKPGYVGLDFGQLRTLERGTVLDLSAGTLVRNVNLVLPRGGALSGTLFDPFGEPATNASVRALRYQFSGGRWTLAPINRFSTFTSDDRGRFRLYGLPPGEYYVEASFPPFGLRGRQDARTYAPTFYPGAVDPDSAERVRLGLSQELDGLDFRLTLALTARVSGRVLDSSGAPPTGIPSVSLIREGVSSSRASLWSSPVAADGTFTVPGVSPGTYTAYASESTRSGIGRFARTPVTVTGDDVDGVLLRLTTGAAARGRIVFEQGTTPDFEPDALQPVTLPSGFDLLPVGRGLGHVDDTWTFDMRGMSGPQLVRLSGLPARWTVSRVELAGRDITDTPIVFNREMPATGLYILITDRVTEIAGSVLDASGGIAHDYTALVFSAEPGYWTYPSRFVRAARPALDGTFSVTALPPGRYLALAAPGIAEGAWTEAAFLEQIRPRAESFSLGHGERRSVQLRLAAIP